MKWVVLGSFVVCLATLSRGSALSCQPGSKDAQCISENTEKESTQPSSNVRERKKSRWAECLAGSEWESKCHRCRCSEEGHAECTRMDTCEKGDDGDPIRCKPRTSFKNECNTCSCLENGVSICTLIGCLSSLPPLQVLPEASTTISPSMRQGKECLPGSKWNSHCNSCFCSEDGLPACTIMACKGQGDEPDSTCAPETSWKNNCNRCWCDNGRAACTRMGCDGPIVTDFKPSRTKRSEGAEPEIVTSLRIHGNGFSKRSAPICKPNASFKVYCNYCECASDGLSYTCTNQECMERDVKDEVEVFMESEGADHIERHSVCKPRGIFHIGCNTCHCSADGLDFSCTNKPCPLPDDVEIFRELRASRTAINEKDVVCAANRMFIKDCNTCWCNEDGTSYFCTRKVCITDLPDEVVEDKPEDGEKIKQKCRPDEVFELDCNMCRCNPDGLSFSCTRRACVPEEKGKKLSLNRRVRATAQGTPKNCQPGLEFRMDCNKCLCDNEGQNYSCTRIDCAAQNNNGNGGARRKRATAQVATQCVPESVFSQDCNVCRCEADGNHATCSIKRCKDDNPEEDADKELSPDSDLSFRCNPGEQFKRGCNDCTCSADGKSVFCTIRLCDQDITPTI
ncbi:uncharacterized protein LOC120637369 isoform X3 [Pararge aegeria]|uniref:uncharacterized protein LOC120637369 isoform X3 n=1 Tax=Pararge aegeria TaxID=116150 RepID=UPI0019D267B5|nr:uncharacterized protein LOC120637369 isoform X3 [Pararge aegeria]